MNKREYFKLHDPNKINTVTITKDISKKKWYIGNTKGISNLKYLKPSNESNEGILQFLR